MCKIIDSNKTRYYYDKLSSEYPETFEWAKHKARWEAIPIGAVFMDYEDHIIELMKEEDEKACRGREAAE